MIKPIDLQTLTGLRSTDLLYLTGWQILSFERQAFDVLNNYLETGGAILIEVPDSGIDLESVKQKIIQDLDTSLQPWHDFKQNSALQSLRTQPFLFSALPLVYEKSIQVWAKGGVVLVVGEVSAAWGLGNGISLSRQDIRTAQEFAINVLSFAWKRRQLTQLSQ